jgi:hypothetical protein
VNLIVSGEFTDLKRAIGKEDVDEVPTVNVFAEVLVQEDMRASEGCMRSWEAAFRKPVGLGDYQRFRWSVRKGRWRGSLTVRPIPRF